MVSESDASPHASDCVAQWREGCPTGRRVDEIKRGGDGRTDAGQLALKGEGGVPAVKDGLRFRVRLDAIVDGLAADAGVR